MGTVPAVLLFVFHEGKECVSGAFHAFCFVSEVGDAPERAAKVTSHGVDELYFLEVSRYIHLNPVKAQMVREPLALLFQTDQISPKNLGNGADICYPEEHERLYQEIALKGCILSEYTPGTKAREYRFPQRNRLIAALSDEVYVIDAGSRSGTETTVEACGRYGRISLFLESV